MNVDASGRYASVPLDVARLRDLRRQKGWSQHGLSLKVGVHGAAAISAWERGLAVPRPARLVRVAEVLGVEPVDLLAVDSGENLSLRELRVTRGMSLRDLAQAANTSPSTLRRWESGDFVRMPDGDAVRALAQALQAEPTQVATGLRKARSLPGTEGVSRMGHGLGLSRVTVW